MKRIVGIFVFSFISLVSFAQEDKEEQSTVTKINGYVVQAIVVDGDTIPIINLPQFGISAKRKFNSKKEAKRYSKLKRDVMRVYPYAKLAGIKLREYNDSLLHIKNEQKKKKYMKEVEDELKKEFGDELKNLTINQGRILIKLVDRETGDTSYELVKELRGAFSAFFWQTLARLFGHNLKARYEAEKEDKYIEEIILLIETNQM